jgi:hypothetical protein
MVFRRSKEVEQEASKEISAQWRQLSKEEREAFRNISAYEQAQPEHAEQDLKTANLQEPMEQEAIELEEPINLEHKLDEPIESVRSVPVIRQAIKPEEEAQPVLEFASEPQSGDAMELEDDHFPV